MSAAWQDERPRAGAPDEEGREVLRIPELKDRLAEADETAAAAAVDHGRLERGLGLRAVRVGDGRYHVTGGRQDHWVDLYSEQFPRCDCGDHLWRDSVCKHMLAALVREGDERVVRAIGELVETLRAA